MTTLTYKFRDRVWETSTAVGTGVVTTSGTAAITTAQTFGSVLLVGDTFPYEMVNRSAAEWEVGLGTWLGSNQFSRSASAVLDGTNGVSGLVNFSAGTKDVILVNPALTAQNGSFRTRVNGSVSLFVDGSLGTDNTGHGFSAGSGAFKTPQFASDQISQFYDLAGQILTVNVAAGTYSGVSLNGYYSSINNAIVFWNGAPCVGTAPVVTFGNSVIASRGAVFNTTFGSFIGNSNNIGIVLVYANNMRLAPTAGPCIDYDPVAVNETSVFFMGNPITFNGTMTLAGCASGGFALVGNVRDSTTTLTVDCAAIAAAAISNPQCIYLGINSSQGVLDGSIWTVNGSVTVSKGFIYLEQNSYAEFFNALSGGTGVSGPKFLVERNSSLVFGGANGSAGRNMLPGSQRGVLRALGTIIDQSVGTNPIATSAGPVGLGGENLNRFAPATGSYSLTMLDYDGIIVIDPTVASSGGTLTLCPIPLHKQRMKFQGGTNAGGTLTLVAGAGTSISGVSTFPMPAGGDAVFDGDNNTWYATRS